MALTDPASRAVGYLILRHLYDGDIIEWPIPDDHPQRPVFEDLEEQGFIARWDRVWPLHDRYRLTERGIAALEAVYRPNGAGDFYNELRQRALSPPDRRAYIASRGLDPFLWPLLHDPWTHWSTFTDQGASYSTYVWEDQRPPRRTRHQRNMAQPLHLGHSEVDRDDLERDPLYEGNDLLPVALVDLDNEADDFGHHAPEHGDYDVS